MNLEIALTPWRNAEGLWDIHTSIDGLYHTLRGFADEETARIAQQEHHVSRYAFTRSCDTCSKELTEALALLDDILQHIQEGQRP
jgi:hypothetical protein